MDPPRRLVQTFRALWGDDVSAEGTSRVTWEIEPANPQLYGGWMMILSGLKTLLETGELLDDPRLAALDRRSAAGARTGLNPCGSALG